MQTKNTQQTQAVSYSMRNIARFLVPSIIGLGFFLVPFPFDGTWTISLGILTNLIRTHFEVGLPGFAVALCVVSGIGSLIYSVIHRKATHETALSRLFDPGIVWVVVRLIGAITSVLVLFQLGPSWLWGDATGGLVLNQLLISILITIGLACVFLPFLTDFGVVEFLGTFAEKVFRALFTVPGNSAVDAVASWLGSGSAGVIVTTDFYEKGIYSSREASVIMTNFSIVSIAFSYVVVSTLNLEAAFLPFYCVLVFAGIVCAIVLPRVPPLSLKKDDYKVDAEPVDIVKGNVAKRAFDLALLRASKAREFKSIGKRTGWLVLEFWLGLIPVTMAFATFSIVVAEHTPFFEVISTPFHYILELAGVDEAKEAAPAMVIGFADMFLPALLASDISSESTRFVVGVVSLGQLIFMSETGALILRSPLKISLWDLVLIFFLRTLVILPIAIAASRLIY
ncbi:MAG: YjiH family protein [Pseudomonadota bacterium]